MNKMNSIIVMLLLSFTVFSCTKDEIIEPPVTPPVVPPVTPPEEPKDVLLAISPTIAGIEPVTRGVITDFTDNDRIGLFLTDGELGTNYRDNAEAANIPAMFLQGRWEVEKNIALSAEGTAYAYYPYNDKAVDGTSIALEIGSQTDYLYATPSKVDRESPIARIGMKHALSLVSVRIRRNDYQHEGKLTRIEVSDVQESGTMNIATGEVIRTGAPTTYSVDRDIVLDDAELLKTQMIMLPTVIAEAQGNIRFRITIDGKVYVWDVPKSHNWEAGKEYTYTLNLAKTPEELPDLELDVDYWTKYGKDDNMQIEDHTQPGTGYYRVMDVEMGSTEQGRTLVKGEAYVFSGVINTRRSSGWKGRVKYTLWQGDRMVEQFPSYYIEHPRATWATIPIPCFLTCEPGTYRLKMLLKEEGKNMWFIPSDRYSEEGDWMFTVQADNRMPSVKSMNLEGFPPEGSSFLFAKLNQPFNMEFTMTNRAGVPLKGEVKAVWHRTFTGEFYLQSDDDGDTWEDEIGRMPVDITAGTKEYKGVIPCTITISRPSLKRWGPTVSFYYKAEGTNTWELMRSDADSELQRWKGADKDKIITGSENHPEKWWGVQGGFNYQFIELE